MIYLKIAIFREDCDSDSSSRRGTAEFMFRDFEPESAGRLAMALLKARGWRYVDIVDATEGDYVTDFSASEIGQRLFREAQTDDVAFEIHEACAPQEAPSFQHVA